MIVQKHEEANSTYEEREKIIKGSGESGQQHCYRGGGTKER